MPEEFFPLLLLPVSEELDRSTKNPGRGRFSRPSVVRQIERLSPQFDRLSLAFDTKKCIVQDSPDGIEPELALVFETIASTANYFAAAKRIEGFEWISEYGLDDIEPDDDFYDLQDKEKRLSGKAYCIMSDHRALNELLSYWRRYRANPEMEFERGFASIRDLFESLKDIRTWSAADRFEDTGILEQWSESLEVAAGTPIPFEIELFYRRENAQRQLAEATVRSIVEQMHGRVMKSCVIDEIAYHGLLAELPREHILDLLSGDLSEIKLAKTDEIMFFRPVAQMMPDEISEAVVSTAPERNEEVHVYSEPIIALLDGLPVSNHELLSGRVTIDDPDDYVTDYIVEKRLHGTAMASLIIHGDLNDSAETSMDRTLYVRPIMKPNHFDDEGFPEGELIVDLVHRAVKRMAEGGASEQAIAPSVKVVNLSIGDPQRQYLSSISPLARLLDWLSWKYKLLFVVSAGNQKPESMPIDANFNDFQNMGIGYRSQVMADAIKSNNRNMRILSPAESINALTVGAVFFDHTNQDANQLGVLPVVDNMPHPISAIGPGVGRMIKPEILVPGGRMRAIGISDDGCIFWGNYLTSGPGCRVAAPRSSQPTYGEAYSIGTSVSAALVSHAAGKLYDILDNVFLGNGETGIPSEYAAILLKAMLVHGADWHLLNDSLEAYYGVNKQQASRWVGYGIPDFSRVAHCTENRVTAIGFGELNSEQGHEYRFPLPIDLFSRSLRRRLTVTLAYFSPTEPYRKEYRKAQLWFTREGKTLDRLVPERENTDWQATQRGTLQHQTYTGNGPIAWDTNDDIEIKISCKKGTDTGAIGSAVPYALFVTVELAEPIEGLYDTIAQRVKRKVDIMADE